MNPGAASPRFSSTGWSELIERGRERGTVTQEEVFEVLDLDADHLDSDLAWIRSELSERGIKLDESVELLSVSDLESAAQSPARAVDEDEPDGDVEGEEGDGPVPFFGEAPDGGGDEGVVDRADVEDEDRPPPAGPVQVAEGLLLDVGHGVRK